MERRAGFMLDVLSGGCPTGWNLGRLGIVRVLCGLGDGLG
jgi:hypothetical protein